VLIVYVYVFPLFLFLVGYTACVWDADIPLLYSPIPIPLFGGRGFWRTPLMYTYGCVMPGVQDMSFLGIYFYEIDG